MTIQATPSNDTYVIAHATDLTPESDDALAHGVALALRSGAALRTYHAAPGHAPPVHPAPDPDALLRRWSAHTHIDHIAHAHTGYDDPVDTLLATMRGVHHDLMIVGTHQHKGWERVTQGSISEALALNLALPTLFVPIGAPGFVDVDTGEVLLRRVLVPAESTEVARSAVDALLPLLERFGVEDVEILVLSVSGGPPDRRPFPGLIVPMPYPKWELTQISRSGDTTRTICEVAEDMRADLIVMLTHGHDTLWDTLLGSKTERVVRDALSPVLSLPWRD